MSKEIRWFSSSVPLQLKGQPYGKNRMSEAEGKAASDLKKQFRLWLKQTGKGADCRGTRHTNFGGFGMNFHDTCCTDNEHLMRLKDSELELLKQFAATDRCSLAGVEAQAEFALRLYQRIKSEEIPYSQTHGKQVTARYRRNRQNWLEILKVKTHVLTQA